MPQLDLTPTDLKLLQDAAFYTPKSRPPGDFGEFLGATFATFFDRLGRFDKPLAAILSPRTERIRTLASALLDGWKFGAQGDADRADDRLSVGLDGISQELLSMSRRHSAKVLKRQCWYRIAAWKGVQLRKHMFHSPFEKAPKSYRFSAPGWPALYLGNSVYLCWLECDQPDQERCHVSRFEVDATGFDYLDLPLNHDAYLQPLVLPPIPGRRLDPRRLMNSPYCDDVLIEVADYLTVWPLLAAALVEKSKPAPEQPPEYVIPQLIMRWTQRSQRFLGVRYFTSKQDRSTNSNDWSINIAIPTRTVKASGYCDFLRARAHCTEPQALACMREKKLEELVTSETADRREYASGRVKLRWPDGRLDDYFRTDFGKMEYWLDRPELLVAPIEPD